MGQKQSYRLDESSATRNVTADGEIAYNTDTPAPGQPTSVLIRPVDNDNIPASPLPSPPLSTVQQETTERVVSMPTTPIEIAPTIPNENSKVLVSVIPATPAAAITDDSGVDVSVVESESVREIEEKQQHNNESPVVNAEISHPEAVVTTIETTTVFVNDQGDEGHTEIIKQVAVVDSSTIEEHQQEEYVSNLHHPYPQQQEEEEYAVDCEQFEKSTVLVEQTSPSSPQPMTPPLP
uniref:Uncharacterized protein n=1 Tax=Ditylenchus dipsaci TaxID=166011 RepID=A0A915DTP6_9BILA